MKSFLEDCAEDILHKYDNDNSVCVVFPNNRTLLHFRKAYARLKNEVSFSGCLYPINRILNQFYRANNADELTLIFQLYEAFRKVFDHDGMLNRDIARDFNSFFDTGRKLLQDFNEIDNYLVDVRQLCRNFADINELEAFYSEYDPEVVEIIKTFWYNFSQEKLSREKERYKELWINLPEVYTIFRKNLVAIKSSYPGMTNRHIVDIIKKGELQTRFSTYVFVGFNVLNKCERKIFSYLRQSGKAKFYWDADNYYIADRAQEAGLFMRGYLQDYPDELHHGRPDDNILHQPKDVQLIAEPLEVAQAKSVHDILDQWASEPGFCEEKCAVILGDEHLMFPVLNAIPPSINKVNVTMGYPFVETPVYSFVINCLQLRNNMKVSKSGTDYYFNDVLGVLNHPLVAQLPEFYSRQISLKIREERMIRVKAEFLASYSNILGLIFYSADSVDKPTDILVKMLEMLSELYFIKNPAQQDTPKIENEFIFNAYTSVKALLNNFASLPDAQVDEDLVVSILKQHLSTIKVPFESDDDRGIQVMGMMETRNLDFTHVVMIGMNEGVFPKKSESDSFITEGMRLAFDMPIVKYKDSVFGYFFYRLFQRSSQVKILYNNVFVSNMSSISGEPSRFVIQLMKEASSSERSDSRLNIEEYQFERFISPAGLKPVSVDNNADSISRLKPFYTMGKEGYPLSPSALNTFISCPFQFYLKYIVKIKPQEELDEESSAADFGSILHKAIEMLYQDHKGADRLITSEVIESLNKVKEKYVLDAYNEHFHLKLESRSELSGFENIFFDVLMQYLNRILAYDKTIAPFELIGAEKGAYATIDIEADGKPLRINIGGTLDRIDRIVSTNQLRIVDYKTGDVSKKMSFESVDATVDADKLDKRPKEAFQVLLYSYVYMQRHPGVLPTPVIYGVRNGITPGSTTFKIGVKKDKFDVDASNIARLTEDFSVRLKEVLTRLFSKDQKFDPCPSQFCDHCNYKGFCKA